jgi:hypothetical protein
METALAASQDDSTGGCINPTGDPVFLYSLLETGFSQSVICKNLVFRLLYWKFSYFLTSVLNSSIIKSEFCHSIHHGTTKTLHANAYSIELYKICTLLY